MKFDPDGKDNATNQQKNNYMISQFPRSSNEKVTFFIAYRSTVDLM